MTAGVREEILRVFEAPRPQFIRIEQLFNRIAHRGIVIENAYQLTLWGHGINACWKLIAGPSVI
jgi:hypothetical protein